MADMNAIEVSNGDDGVFERFANVIQISDKFHINFPRDLKLWA
jgi:hypothetical protein